MGPCIKTVQTNISNSTYIRPVSDADLFMSRTYFECGPTQMNKSTPVVSDAKLNSRSTAVPNTASGSASKHVIIIYAFGSAHEKFGV